MRDTDVAPTILCPGCMHLSELMEVSRFWIVAGICRLPLSVYLWNWGVGFHKEKSKTVLSQEIKHENNHSPQIGRKINPKAPESWSALPGRSILLQLTECFDLTRTYSAKYEDINFVAAAGVVI